MSKNIEIKGIQTNNLQNIDVTIRDGINLILGPSGSGKSSLAYDTIAQIGQHEYLSMFSDEVAEPTYKVNSFTNMIATVPIEQLNHNNNMRSTIGTYFGMNRLVALLYAVALEVDESQFVLNRENNLCENCKGLGFIKTLDVNRIVDYNVPLYKVPFRCWNRYKDFYAQILGKYCEERGIDAHKTFRELTEYEKQVVLYGESAEKYSVSYKKTHANSKKTSKFYGVMTNKPMLPNFNIGKDYYGEVTCPSCNGKKYNSELLKFKLLGISIGDFMTQPFSKLVNSINKIEKEIHSDRLKFTIQTIRMFVNKAVELNLGHLYFHRAIPTLSGGELQRLRMVQVFNSQLSNLIIVLDEPLAGLSGSEKKHVYNNIVDLSNKHIIVIVDHGRTFYDVASNVIVLGTGGGHKGGKIIDTPQCLKSLNILQSFTVLPLADEMPVVLYSKVYAYNGVNITLANNRMNLIVGHSGVGKSTLLREYFPQFFEKYLYISQKSILGNKNSAVASVLGINNRIAELFALKFKKDKKYFSNLTGNDGMCPTCEGAGYLEYGNEYNHSMRIECKDCGGTGFHKRLKKHCIHGVSILDVWKMTLDDAKQFFGGLDKRTADICNVASEIMLGHLYVGQPISTLSGGENIRIKLLKALKSTATVIGVDEPFKGLSAPEIYRVATFLESIRSKGKTVVVVDHTEGVERYFTKTIHLNIKNKKLIEI